ncbi:hypothetical protein DS909_18585 [Phaeobacter gallaeciensis]|uniref:Uncharacterized protein n=2 Tax=Roseobacteraceae TaxID=2854170 RepID=A0A366WR26_9RHOB|nr:MULTISPECIES: hypothetical protein [Roseobacteraceae]MBT3143072.1 hypothetical protein [Falsiruegeria litorea]MBT8166824.1 hypothetical protein [Falsiruegeria litorea]RBW51597.1 hypothetical protein DS909_18585 [Phaeobacter gallaeciensis]
MRLLISVLVIVLIALVGASANLLLQACGVTFPFTGNRLGKCEQPLAASVVLAQSQADQDAIALTQRIQSLEQRLARLQCKADPPPPPPPPPPPKPKTPSGLKPDAFDEADISVMEGCWELSSDYAVREINTGQITRFKYWRICFDKNGRGTEQMRSTNGVRCNGRLTGRMPGNGVLTMREPGNLKCDNDSSIFRRDITCRIDSRGRANCDTYQPETNGRSSATLRRARR